MNKRTFLKNISIVGGIPAAGKIDKLLKKYEHHLPLQLSDDETFWQGIRGDYRIKQDYINLENGYYSILPQATLDAYISHIREINLQGAYYMRTKQFDDKQMMVEKLAALAGCTAAELIITRNTTEALDTVIAGTHWQAGDEAVMAEQDYGAMLDMFKLVGSGMA